jgi:hypothetical protein
MTPSALHREFSMNLRRYLSIVALFTIANPALATDFVPLFNGKDLSGWTAFVRPSVDIPKPDALKCWTVNQGVLHCTGKPTGFLSTDKEFENYTLRVKWKYPSDAFSRVKRPNSGVLIHINGSNKVWPLSYEVQLANGDAGDLWLQEDDYKKFPSLEVEKARHDPKQPRRFIRIGGIEKSFEKPLGEWNQTEITCRGGAINVHVNGVLVNETKDGSLKRTNRPSGRRRRD